MAPPVKAKGGGLGKKVGPLPLWAWGVIVLAVTGFFFLRSRGAGAATATGGDGTPLASGGGQGGGGASGGGDNGQPAVILGTNPVGATGNGSVDLGPAPTSIISPDPGANQPTSNFGGGEVQGIPALAPVATGPSAPGSDYLTGGVASHPGAQGTTGGYVAPNYAALNTPTEPTNVHRPGVQI